MKKSGMFVLLASERSERDTYRGNTIENRGCLFIYTSGVLEHKWRASLKLHYC